MVLTQIFKNAIPVAFHTGATGMGQRGFGTLTPKVILAWLIHLYSRPSFTELDQALTRLHNPMDCAAPIEVMLCNIKEI